jgi:dipeptidyl aminopeptidase/acylaminoacyl peptidase
MRSEHEWLTFLERLEADRVTRVTTGTSELVHPREDIMVPTPERRATTVKSDVDSRTPTSVELRSAEAILAYKPIEVVARISPRALMIIGVENDAVTPTDHAIALYDEAGEPKRLILQRHTTHYAAYAKYGDEVVPQIVEWFDSHLRTGDLSVSNSPG